MPLAARFGYALLAVLVLPFSAGADDEGVALRWKFTPQQTSRYATSQEVTIEMRHGGRSQVIDTRQTSDMTWVVDAVDDDGDAHITQVIERVRLKSTGLGAERAFDSDDDKLAEGADDPSVEALRLMVGQPVRLVIDPRGKVVDVRLSDQFSEKLKRSPHAGALAAMFSRDHLKQMTKMNTLELPGEPLSRGATWEQRAMLTDPVAGKQNLLTTYRYDGLQRRGDQDLDKISATAKIALADEKKAAGRLSVKDQKSNGVIWFDRAAGRIQEMQMTTKVVTELGMDANKAEQTMTTKMHAKLVSETDKPASDE